jgi:uncharacterized protein (DUF427 family)
MNENNFSPIIILGAARSGTTMLANLLEMHDDVKYWEEPNIVWKYKSAFLGHDAIPEHLATEDRINYITEKFKLFAGSKIFMEKTPANCLRIGFITKVFPSAKIIHVIRDGRDVALSVKHQWERTRDNNKYYAPNEDQSNFREIKKRLKKVKSIPIYDLPSYSGLIFDSLLSDLNIKRKYKYWGPRFPGYQDYVKMDMSKIEIAAIQWKYSIETVLNYEHVLSSAQYIKIKYEDFIASPQTIMNDIMHFCGLKITGDMRMALSNIRSSASNWKQELSQDEIASIEKLIGNSLKYCGYKLNTNHPIKNN